MMKKRKTKNGETARSKMLIVSEGCGADLVQNT